MLRSLLLIASISCVARLAAQTPLPAEPASATRPALHVMLDTASLRAALAVLPPQVDPRRISRVFTIGFDTTGRPLRPLVTVPALIPVSIRDTLVALLVAHLRPIPPPPARFELRLLLETGPQARVEETTIELRQAMVADRQRLTRRLQVVTEEAMRKDEALVGTERALRLRVHLSAEGLVTDIAVDRSSGRTDIDAAVLAVVRTTRFEPLLVEGVPMATVVTLPLRLMFAE